MCGKRGKPSSHVHVCESVGKRFKKIELEKVRDRRLALAVIGGIMHARMVSWEGKG